MKIVECSAGEWGPDCALCCHCASGTCSGITGECIGGKCSDCWTGLPTCQESKAFTNLTPIYRIFDYPFLSSNILQIKCTHYYSPTVVYRGIN